MEELDIAESGKRCSLNIFPRTFSVMLLTLKIKLKPTSDQRVKLLRAMEAFNPIAKVAKMAYETRAFARETYFIYYAVSIRRMDERF